MCLRFHHLDPPKFLSAPGLSWQVALKNTEVKLKLLADTDMILMFEKGIRGGIVMQFIHMKKLIINI